MTKVLTIREIKAELIGEEIHETIRFISEGDFFLHLPYRTGFKPGDRLQVTFEKVAGNAT